MRAFHQKIAGEHNSWDELFKGVTVGEASGVNDAAVMLRQLGAVAQLRSKRLDGLSNEVDGLGLSYVDPDAAGIGEKYGRALRRERDLCERAVNWCQAVVQYIERRRPSEDELGRVLGGGQGLTGEPADLRSTFDGLQRTRQEINKEDEALWEEGRRARDGLARKYAREFPPLW